MFFENGWSNIRLIKLLFIAFFEKNFVATKKFFEIFKTAKTEKSGFWPILGDFSRLGLKGSHIFDYHLDTGRPRLTFFLQLESYEELVF